MSYSAANTASLLLPFASGRWAPKKKKQQFPLSKRFAEQSSIPTYQELSFPTKDGRSLGVYVSPNFKENPNPPIFVIVGGLGFGGPVPANNWRNYLGNWNPILIDPRGSGNSYPMADITGTENGKVLDDLEAVILSTGLREIPIAGYSYAGTLALMLADRLTDLGCSVPFVSAISPTMCDTDRDWCFDYSKIGPSFSDSVKNVARARWNALAEKLDGISVTTDSVLHTYARLMRDPNPNAVLDAFVRMRLWEDAPYMHLNENFNVDSVRATLKKGLKVGKTPEDFIYGLSQKRISLDEFFKDPKQVPAELKDSAIDEYRTATRDARTHARYIANIMVWTEAWLGNCGFESDGLLPVLKKLQAKNIPALITQNTGDPLLPAGQMQRWLRAWPEAVRALETSGHGLNSDIAKRALFAWTEEKRMALCGPAGVDDRLQRSEAEFWFRRDMGDALTLSAGSVDKASALMATTARGSREALNEAASCSLPALDAAQKREALRMRPYILEKKQWLDARSDVPTTKVA